MSTGLAFNLNKPIAKWHIFLNHFMNPAQLPNNLQLLFSSLLFISVNESAAKKMQQRSTLSLSKLLPKYPSYPSPKPTYPLLKSHPPLSRSPLYQKPSSNPPPFNIPTSQVLHFSTQSSKQLDKDKIVDEINMKFAEAREEIEAAMDSKETVYFNEEAECARHAVKEVLDLFDGLLGKLEVNEREGLQRAMGLKMEQLKAELKQLDD